MKKTKILKETIKIIGLCTAIIGVLVFGAGIANASISVDGGNDTTGPCSENQNDYNIDSKIVVDLSNISTVDNDQIFEVETGKIKLKQNTKAEDLSTGNIWGDIEVENSLNSGDIELMNTNIGDIDFDITNDTTGPNSENKNEIDIDFDRDIDISNHADIDNDLYMDLNTGESRIDHNTMVGDIDTGDINISSDIKNTANGGMGDIDLSGMGGISISGEMGNELTGPNSENTNKIKIESEVDVKIRNNANIVNDLVFGVNSGRNKIDHNTVVGDISTGSVHLDVSTTNIAN